MKPERTSAYQGKGWRPRKLSLRKELAAGTGIWNSMSVNSEWAHLKAVALYLPRAELRGIRNPRSVQHLQPLIPSMLRRQYQKVRRTFLSLGVDVVELKPGNLPKGFQTAPPNLMFVRDLFLGTPEGYVIGRMASRVRAGEEKFAAAMLASRGVPIVRTVSGRGLFEGADALWLSPTKMLCGVGNRTNREGFLQLREILRAQGVQCESVVMSKGVQHLLGILQIVGPKMAVVRVEKASRRLLTILQREGYAVLPIRESEEVVARQAMNFVTVERGQIVMASGCPETRARLEEAGVRVLAEVDISQLGRAAGGLACATGILARRIVR